jgi:hypothetical protein
MTGTNAYFTCNNKRVTIGSVRVEYAMVNNFVSDPLAVPTTAIVSSGPVKLFNMLRVITRYTINGWISTGLNPQASTPVERTNAYDVLADLIEMANRRVVSTLSMPGFGDKSVCIEKINAREEAMDLGGEAPSGVVRYDITITCVEGVLMF